MSATPLNFTLAGAILPAIGYLDINGNAQQLNMRMPPRQVNPIAPAPIGADNTASDGTMWSTSWYVEGFMEFKATVLIGPDLTNWINFLAAAINGQVVTFYPNQAKLGVSAGARLMVQGRSNQTGSNIPTGDPRPKYKSPGVYEVDIVLRFEQPQPLSPPAAPALGSAAGGTLAAATYQAQITYVNQTGESLPSAQAALAVAADDVLTVASPAAAGNASGWNVYAASGGTLTRQNAAPIAIGTAWTEPTTGLVAGASVPVADSTGMAEVFNQLNGIG